MISSENAPFQVFDIESHWILEEEKRLNASFYAKDVIAAKVLLNTLKQNGIELASIQSLCKDIFHRPRFKRNYVNVGKGLPFLTPTDLFKFPLTPRKAVTNPPSGLSILPGWILLTCSGTVGRTLISNKFIAQCILSHDVIRLVSKSHEFTGYIYAFLNCWAGKALLGKDQYGAAVKHIEPHQVASVQVPIIPRISKEINQKICNAHKLREDAQELFQIAEEKLYSDLGLPKIEEEEIEYFGGKNGKIAKTFETAMSESNLRLDASYHQPIIDVINNNLDRSKLDIEELGRKIETIDVPPRFKRPYVEEGHGLRYLRPADLPTIKALELKYLSTAFTDNEKYKLNEDEILVVTDGTIGWVSIVTPLIAGWYGSNNIARIVPKAGLHSGYLLTYLLSPYGQYQLTRGIFGGVIDHITEDQIKKMRIPFPSYSVQQEIGEAMRLAYAKRDDANQIETDAVALLETEMTEAARVA